MSDATSGLFALAGVALGWAGEFVRERSATRTRHADEKAVRLRAAYADVVAAADDMRQRAVGLDFLMLLVTKQFGSYGQLNEELTKGVHDFGSARRSLLLESDAKDRAVLVALANVQTSFTGFLALLRGYIERDEALPTVNVLGHLA